MTAPDSPGADTGGLMLAALAGFAALGAEVVYLKALDFSVGAAPVVKMTVVATFIVGVGLGSLLSARVQRPWFAEGVAAVWAALWLFGFDTIVAANGMVIAAAAPLVGPNVAAGLVGFAHLVVPTLALGIALPAIIETEGDLGRVYAHHAIGAFVGIAVFEAVAYPAFGLPGAWALLVFAHLGVLWLWLQRRQRRGLARLRIGRMAWPLFVAGVATGGFQGAWLLIAALIFRPFYFVAPAVIGSFIVGQAIGAVLWRRVQHDFSTALRWSALGAGLTTILAAAWLLVPRPETPWGTAAALGLILAPAAVPIGTLYPAWTRAVERTETGGALVSLSVGNAIGVFVGGGLLLSVLPPLWVLVALAAALAALGVRHQAVRVWVVILAASVVATTTDDAAFFRGRDGEITGAHAELVVRGPGELTAIYQAPTKTDPERRLHQNGYSPMNLEPGRGLEAESTVGAFGVLHAPRLERALVLGAGSGRTAGFVATAFGRTDVVDVGANVPTILRALSDENYGLLDNPNAEYLEIDGILAPHLLPANSYDLIVHTLHPGYVDRAAKLYTQEYFEALAGLLREDGVLVTWSDASVSLEANRTYQATVASVFPQPALYGVRQDHWDYSYYVLVAGRGSPMARRSQLTSLADDPAVVALLSTPLDERLLPALPGGAPTHRFDAPALSLLTGGFTTHELSPCRGVCRPGDALRETQPCGPDLAGRRTKDRVCTRACEWSTWSPWTECIP